jgi:uncharacterized protein YndB with AHSA1/START domain
VTKAGFSVERTVVIRARRATVFRYFTDAGRFAAWWGAGSSIEGRPDGEVQIRYPNGSTAGGKVLEIVDGERIVFTFGYDGADKPIPRGGSRVTITLDDHADGTRVRLLHEVADAPTRDAHVPGWRFQLSRFADVVAAEEHADVAALADRFFAAWNEADEAKRRDTLDAIVTDDVEFRDAWAAIAGRDELAAHIAAARMHMPGALIRRDERIAHCQGTAVAKWIWFAADGAIISRGINVITLAPDGKIAKVVGIANAS